MRKPYHQSIITDATVSGRMIHRTILCLILCIWLFTASAIASISVYAAPQPQPEAVASAEQEVNAYPNPNRFVYVVPVHDKIDAGLQQFMKRAFREAEEVGAQYIVLDINTFGGYLDTAMHIGSMIQVLKIPTVAFVHGQAFSAGSYIALNADQIIMQPGSAIGAAAIVDGQGKRITDSKMISGWVSKMRSAAEQSGRNPIYAEGMVDDQLVVEIPELSLISERGQLISFSAVEAVKVGYAEHIAVDLAEVLDYIGASGYSVVEVEVSLAEQVGRFLTNPFVQTLLLIIGIAGLFIELIVPGFGLPGILGVAGFVLYFLGNYLFGFAGVEHIVLFVAGVILMLLELFVPSFGVLGILGIISLFSGVILSAHETGQAAVSLGIALIVAVIVVTIVARIFKHRGVWNKFILRDRLDKESGFISNIEHPELVGATGVASTVLRPSGTAIIDGQRYDVVTNGEYITAGTLIKVIQVEGLRIVVSEWKE